jgi:basic membrane lipoprotein Med (substrate-binding protein (PBP1-ABC) superfamily)
MTPRSRVFRPAALTISSLLVLAACSSTPAASTGTNPTAAPANPSSATSSQAAASPSQAAAGGSAAASNFKVAVVANEPTTDNGYAQDAAQTVDKLKAATGADVTLSANVQLPNAADVFRQFANQGTNLIVAWGGQFTDPMKQVAGEFPNTKFLIVNGTEGNGTNLASEDIFQNEWAFEQGYLASRLSKNGTVGFVGGQCFPSTAEDTNGAGLGAKYANPNVKFVPTWTGDFNDATKAKNATQALIEQGVDSIATNTSAIPGVVAGAQPTKTPVITTFFVPPFGTDVIAGAMNQDLSPWVIKAVKAIQGGTFEGKAVKEHLPADWGPIVQQTPLLPDSIYQDVLKVQADVASGKITVADDTTCPK